MLCKLFWIIAPISRQPKRCWWKRHFFWTPMCNTLHKPNVRGIKNKKNVAHVIRKARSVTQFIYDHTWLIALMKKFTNTRSPMCLKATRFSSHFLALKSIAWHKRELIHIFSSEDWLNSKLEETTVLLCYSKLLEHISHFQLPIPIWRELSLFFSFFFWIVSS